LNIEIEKNQCLKRRRKKGGKKREKRTEKKIKFFYFDANVNFIQLILPLIGMTFNGTLDGALRPLGAIPSFR